MAKTGSGKTVAFLWPLLVHIMKQRPLLKGDGPIGLILVPTRELAMQIYSEAKKFGKVYNLSVVCAYGGGSKWEQSKAFEAGAEIAVSVDAELDTVLNGAMPHLSKGISDLKQRCTQLATPFWDTIFHALSHGVIHFVRSVRLRNHFLLG